MDAAAIADAAGGRAALAGRHATDPATTARVVEALGGSGSRWVIPAVLSSAAGRPAAYPRRVPDPAR